MDSWPPGRPFLTNPTTGLIGLDLHRLTACGSFATRPLDRSCARVLVGVSPCPLDLDPANASQPASAILPARASAPMFSLFFAEQR